MERFDGITRGGDMDADEALTPEEEQMLKDAGNIGAPEFEPEPDDEPFERTQDEAPAPYQHLLPASLRKRRAPNPSSQTPLQVSAQPPKPAPAPKSTTREPISTEQIGAMIGEMAATPKASQPASNANPPIAEPVPQPDVTQSAALRWQRPDFKAHAMAAYAQQRMQDPEPPADNVILHLEWQLREQGRQIEQLRLEQQLQSTFDRDTRALELAENQERAWAASHADYQHRVNFVRDRRERELELMGFVDPAARQRVLSQEAAILLAGALRSGRNPAEVVHELAERWGFRS
jgi:hypothetical protein